MKSNKLSLNAIMFDFDGVIIDSRESVYNSLKHSFEKNGIILPDKRTIFAYVGNPLDSLIKGLLKETGADESIWKELVIDYRKDQTEKGINETKLYPNIKETLAYLKDKGMPIVLCTAKFRKFVDILLETLEIKDYFDIVVSNENDSSKAGKQELTKEELVAIALKKINSSKKEVAIVGDTIHDINGGKANGIHTIAVTYGFNTKEQLQEAEPDFIIENLEDLKKILNV